MFYDVALLWYRGFPFGMKHIYAIRRTQMTRKDIREKGRSRYKQQQQKARTTRIPKKNLEVRPRAPEVYDFHASIHMCM